MLSKEALRRFGTREVGVCDEDKGAEDVKIGRCMTSLGVTIGDSRDNLNRSRFHCFRPASHINTSYPKWYISYDQQGGQGVRAWVILAN